MGSASDRLLVQKAARIKDVIAATAIIAVGAYGSMSIVSTRATGFVDNQTMNHTTLPSIWGILLMLLGGLWLIQVVIELLHINRSLKQQDGVASIWSIDRMFPDLSPLLLFRMGATVVALTVYAMLFEELPFFLTTAVFLFLMLIVFGRQLSAMTAAIAIAGSAVFHALFVMFLKLPL